MIIRCYLNHITNKEAGKTAGFMKKKRNPLTSMYPVITITRK